jgi:acyl dehydratase
MEKGVITLVDNSLLTEPIKGLLGAEAGPWIYEIEKGMVRRFCIAIDDPNPLWQNEAYARQTKYGGVIAPPTFVATGLESSDGSALADLMNLVISKLPANIGHVDGGISCEQYQPIRAGDVISVTSKLAELTERQGKAMGNMLFTVFELTSRNQRNEVVAKIKRTFCHYLIQ